MIYDFVKYILRRSFSHSVTFSCNTVVRAGGSRFVVILVFMCSFVGTVMAVSMDAVSFIPSSSIVMTWLFMCTTVDSPVVRDYSSFYLIDFFCLPRSRPVYDATQIFPAQSWRLVRCKTSLKSTICTFLRILANFSTFCPTSLQLGAVYSDVRPSCFVALAASSGRVDGMITVVGRNGCLNSVSLMVLLSRAS